MASNVLTEGRCQGACKKCWSALWQRVMIQISVALSVAADAFGDISQPFMVTPHEDGVRLTGIWPEAGPQDLGGVFAELATLIAPLDPEVTFRDLFTDRVETVAEALCRLRKELRLEDIFSWRSFRWQGLHFWRLLGCYTFGKSDLLVEPEDDVPVAAVEEMLSHLARYRWMSERTIEPGDAIPFGFWLVSLASSSLYGDEFWAAARHQLGTQHLAAAFDERMTTPPPQFVIEVVEMTMGGEFDWVVGVSRTLRTLEAQRRTHERIRAIFHLEEVPKLMSPYGQDPAVVASDVEGSKAIFGQRRERVNEEDSGWHFGSADEGADPETRELAISTVCHLTQRIPGLICYLGLPPGWVVAHDSDGFWVSPPSSVADGNAWLDVDGEKGAPWLPLNRDTTPVED